MGGFGVGFGLGLYVVVVRGTSTTTVSVVQLERPSDIATATNRVVVFFMWIVFRLLCWVGALEGTGNY